MNDSYKKNTILLIVVLLMGLVIIGGTFAYFTYGFNATNGNYVSQTECFNIIYDNGSDITGTLFPSSGPLRGLNGSVSLKISDSCKIYGTATLKLHVDSSVDEDITKSVSSYCISRKTLEKINGISTKEACTTANGRWMGYSDDYCENPDTLERIVDYTTQSDCTTNGGSWKTWTSSISPLKYAVYSRSVQGIPKSVGYITSSDIGNDIIINNNIAISNTQKNIYIYIWLDGYLTDNSINDLPFSGYISSSVTQSNTPPSDEDPSGANPPELTSGMVPVKLNENGTVVTTVDPVSSNDWYNYSQQKWANAVLVDSSVRSNYIDSSGNIIPNVNVDTSKILAYYVWIPRYKYTFADNSTQNPYPVQSIDIVFEGKNAPRATGGANGPNDYYTHPAFTWNFTGDTLDESTPNLGGIWVGKFELSNSSTSNMNCTSTSCGTNANNIRILPNKTALFNNTVSSFFYAIRSMQQSGNSFGLPTDTTTADSHMMKNREWGAVAYLAHSQYGLGNQEVRINSYSSYKTGCGASTTSPSSSGESTCYDPYGKTTTTSPSTTGDISTYPQSTTGNITGVFDTSGGFGEYVMGNYNGTNSSAGFSSLPVLKYYDKYTVTSYSNCTFAQCGGHALEETASWHGDSAGFTSSTYPWFFRGGYYKHGSYAGSFYSGHAYGDGTINVNARSVVVVS